VDPRVDLARFVGLILVVNAGSTSLKLHVVDGDESIEVPSLDDLPDGIEMVAHRVVHGGALREPAFIDDALEARLSQLVELAPLHNAPAVDAIVRARRLLPEVPHVAVFDTAFHATIPVVATTYALPESWRREIQRYGFHGLSVQWSSEQVRASRLVVCHLGGGCSVTAVRDGRSVDTTMGFTPLEGVPMATRPGTVDPGALLYLLRRGLGLPELDDAIERRSGLLALSGISGDVAELEAARIPAAELALDVFTYRVACAVGAMAVALDGIDALVFTAGIGEHSGRVRRDVCARLRFLGIDLDDTANDNAEPDVDIAGPSSRVRVVVIRAREELVAARAARALAMERA
jgi:acetate kinase